MLGPGRENLRGGQRGQIGGRRAPGAEAGGEPDGGLGGGKERQRETHRTIHQHRYQEQVSTPIPGKRTLNRTHI